MDRLPDFDVVRAQRERMLAVTRAHEALHALYAAEQQLPGWVEGEPLPGDEALREAMTWPEVAQAVQALPKDAAQAHRLEVARLTLEPLGSGQHDDEHALEALLYDQFQRLQSEPALAALRARLDPLYAERQALYETLIPLAEEHGFVQAGVELIAHMEVALLNAWRTSEGQGHPPDRVAIALQIADELCEALADTLPNLRITSEVPRPDPALEGLSRLKDAVRALATFHREELDAERIMGEEVERQHDRWKVIEREIQAITG